MRVEKVSYTINWSKFRRGYSFFIPCLNPEAARTELLTTTRRLKLKVLTKVTIEDGIQGLRVWRV
jgi:hypothetical protein